MQKQIFLKLLLPLRTSTGQTFSLRALTLTLISCKDFTFHYEMWDSFTHSSHTCRIVCPGILRRSQGDCKKTSLTHKHQKASLPEHLISVQSQLSGPKHCPPPESSSQSKHWLSHILKLKTKEVNVWDICIPKLFNPSTLKAEVGRSLVRPGWCTWWDLSQTQPHSDTVTQ